jgi:hypothetical protein
MEDGKKEKNIHKYVKYITHLLNFERDIQSEKIKLKIIIIIKIL